MRVSKVAAEPALTRDTLPVNVDATVFRVVRNAEKSILRSGELFGRDHYERANCFAGIHRAARAGEMIEKLGEPAYCSHADGMGGYGRESPVTGTWQGRMAQSSYRHSPGKRRRWKTGFVRSAFRLKE